MPVQSRCTFGRHQTPCDYIKMEFVQCLRIFITNAINYGARLVRRVAGSGPQVLNERQPHRVLLAEELLATLDEMAATATSSGEKWRADHLESLYNLVMDLDPKYIGSSTIILLNAFREDCYILLERHGYGVSNTHPEHLTILKLALSKLYRWLSEGRCPTHISDWVLRFIVNMEKMRHVDLLIDTSLIHIDGMMDDMANRAGAIKELAPVVLRILASMREIPEIMFKISGLRPVIQRLEATSFDRDVLQDIDDVASLIIYTQMKTMRPPDRITIERTYSEFIKISRRPEKTSTRRWGKYLKVFPWLRTPLAEVVIEPRIPLDTPSGLVNMGNTCYLNAIMQALLLTRTFSNHCIKNMSSLPIWAEMAVVFRQMSDSSIKKIVPTDFYMAVKLPYKNLYEQEDSSEFLIFLLNLLQQREFRARERRALRPNWSGDSSSADDTSGAITNSTSPSRKRSASANYAPRPLKKRFRSGPNFSTLPEVSFIQETFGGTLRTIIRCTICKTSSNNRDLFRHLQLGFPENAESGQHSVQSLLDYYCSPELLTGDNRYRCSKCNVLTDAQRSVVIDIAPKYLIIILKIFKYERQLQRLTKLIHKVHHNHRIHLPTSSRRLEKSIYDLYATVIHSGTTLDSGHYYTIGNDDGQWYSFNDDEVQPCSKDDVNSLEKYCTPYILFYRRSDIEEEATVPSRKSCLRDRNNILFSKKAKRVRFNI